MSEVDPAKGAPPWVAQYLPAFREVLDDLALTEGFVLVPVEVPGTDVSNALADWLLGEGFAVERIEPASREEWGELVAKLFSLPAAERRIVVLIGKKGEGVGAGLHLLNQRRDTLARHLNCPLLWCGPADFLAATWENAPDFWSIRVMRHRLMAPAQVRPEKTHETQWIGGADGGQSIDELTRLFESARRQGDWRNAARVGVQLADALGTQSHFAEARSILEAALGMLDGGQEQALDAHVRVHLAQILLVASETQRSAAELEKALSTFTQLGDKRGQASALRNLGKLSEQIDRLKDAEAAFSRALLLYRDIGDPVGAAEVLRGLGDLYVRTSRLADAEATYGEALHLHRAGDNRLGVANTLRALGTVYELSDRLQQAEAAYLQALPLFRAVGARLGEANTLDAQGLLYVAAGRLREAEAAFDQALLLHRAIDDPLGEANTLMGLGDLARVRRQPRLGFGLYMQALGLERRIGDRLGQGACHHHLARAAMDLNQPLRAVVLGGRALATYQSLEERYRLVVILRDLARALGKIGDQTGALSAFFLAWFHAVSIGEASADGMGESLRKLMNGFDPSQPPEPGLVDDAKTQLAASLAACEAKLREQGIDPYVLSNEPESKPPAEPD